MPKFAHKLAKKLKKKGVKNPFAVAIAAGKKKYGEDYGKKEKSGGKY